jgi:hypothetical protein
LDLEPPVDVLTAGTGGLPLDSATDVVIGSEGRVVVLLQGERLGPMEARKRRKV